MRWSTIFNKNVQVGVDIQPQGARLLKLSRNRRKIRIEQAAFRELPVGAVQEGKIQQFALVQSCLVDLVGETHSKGCRAAIGLPMCLVMSKKISVLPQLSQQDQEAEVTKQLASFSSRTDETLCFDYVRLPGLSDNLLFAVKQEHLVPYFNLAENAGLQVQVVDIDFYALLRSVLFSLKLSKTDTCLMVLDLQYLKSQWAAVYQNEIIFSRSYATLHQEELYAMFKQDMQQSFIHCPALSHQPLFISGGVSFVTEFATRARHEFHRNVVEFQPFGPASFVPPISQTMAVHYLVAGGLALWGTNYAEY